MASNDVFIVSGARTPVGKSGFSQENSKAKSSYDDLDFVNF